MYFGLGMWERGRKVGGPGYVQVSARVSPDIMFGFVLGNLRVEIARDRLAEFLKDMKEGGDALAKVD